MRPVRHAEPGSRRLLPGLGYRGAGSAGRDRGDGQPDPGGRRRGRGDRRRLVPGGRPAGPAVSPVTREAARPHTMPVADVTGPRGLLMLDDLAGKRTGERIQVLRERRGLSRPVLAGLVGTSRLLATPVPAAPSDGQARPVLTGALPHGVRLSWGEGGPQAACSAPGRAARYPGGRLLRGLPLSSFPAAPFPLEHG